MSVVKGRSDERRSAGSPLGLPLALTSAGLLAGLVLLAAARGLSAGLWALLVAGVWLLGTAGLALVLRAWERRQRAAEAAHLASERRLAQAQKMEAVGRLAGGIAHDVNNHLATIRALAELVAARELPRERVVEKMGRITATVIRASALIERLLTFARRQPSRPEPVDLNEVVEAFERMMRGTLPPGIALEVALAPALPSAWLDLAQIEQVLANLFVNARDALGGAGRIRIATRALAGAAGPEVELTVADDGPGIPPELTAKVFEPFFSTKSGQGATGLGLATVQAIVEEAGGQIELESAPGRGATFRLRFPGAAVAAARPVRAAPVAGAPAARGERLLVVDDNEEFTAALVPQLLGLGYRVEVASSTEAALALVADGLSFDLVITDVQMRGVPGTELVDRLRQAGPVRALYMSGYTDRIALRRGPGKAESYFLKKPFSFDGLARMVRELLDAPAVGAEG